VDVAHRVKSLGHQFRPVLEGLIKSFVFTLKLGLGLRRDAFSGWVYHKFDHKLANRVGAEVNGLEFHQLFDDCGIEIVQIKVSAAQSAFSKQSL
jgi:hypothetical protein